MEGDSSAANFQDLILEVAQGGALHVPDTKFPRGVPADAAAPADAPEAVQ